MASWEGTRDRYLLDRSTATEAGILAGMEGELADEALIELWRTKARLDDGQDPLESLLRRYQGKIARWCLHALVDRDDAADCAQETLIRIARGMDRFRDESRFSTWAYVIARKTCATALARRQRSRDRETLSDDLEQIDGRDPVPPDEPTVESIESRTKLRSLLRRHLTEEELEILVLHHEDGLSMKEITAKLSLQNKSGARAYLASAKRKLRTRLLSSELEALGFSRPGPGKDER